MKKNLIRSVCALFFMVSVFGCQTEEKAMSNQTLDQTSDLDSASYLIGYQQMRTMLDQTGDAINLDAFALGTADAVAGKESQVAADRGEAAMQALSQAINSDKSVAGDQFRTANGARPEVTTLASGLQYEVIKAGTGPKPGPTDTVSTHYRGTLIDGTVFDSSVDRGVPLEIPVNRVIAGWTEALQLMAVGSKWRLVIPPELGYGDRGSGGVIPPQATLVFEVELLDIVD